MPHKPVLIVFALLFTACAEAAPAAGTCEVADEITVCVRDRCGWGTIDWVSGCASACASFLEETGKIEDADPLLVENLGFSLVCWIDDPTFVDEDEIEGACEVAKSDSPELLTCLDEIEGSN